MSHDTSQPSLAELREADAPAPIRAIYEEIRHWSGVPMVALIFRHLATHAGVLEEVWAGLGPLFRAGQIQERAWRVARQTVPGGLLAPIGDNARPVLGLTDDALASVRGVLDSYNRANPVNLLSMLALVARLDNDPPARPRVAAGIWAPPVPIAGPLPPMTPPDAMAPDVRRLINDLGLGDRSTLSPVVPSLYRHLTAWPAYLATLHVTLVPRLVDGTLARTTDAMQQAMAREAQALGAHLPPLPRLAAVPGLRDTVLGFSGTFIPMMIVAGHAMREQLE